MALNYPNKEAFQNEQLEIQDWFWPEASRTVAEQTLAGQEIGCFLVRPSSQPNCMALSHVIKDHKVGHALIMKNNDLVTLEGTQREFSSIEQLVGMLNLTPAEMPPAEKDKLAERRKNLFEATRAHKDQYQARVTEAKQQGEQHAKMREAKALALKRERENRLKAEEESRRAQLTRKRELLSSVPDLDRRVESKISLMRDQGRFTDKEVAQIRNVFDEFDSVHVGGFTREDVSAVFEKMGETPAPSDIDQFMRELDADGNGVCTFDEFLECVDLLDDEVRLLEDPLVANQLSPRRNIQHSQSVRQRPAVRKTMGGLLSPPTGLR